MRLIDADAAADKIMHEIEVHADEIGATAIMIAFARALRDETYFPTIDPEVMRMDKQHVDKPQQLCDKLLRMIQECDEVINGDTNEPATVLDGMTIFEFRTVLQSVLFYLRA